MDLSAATLWWVAAGVAVAAELATGTFYLLMLALGLAAGALAAHLGLSSTLQIVAAAVVAAAATALWHWKRAQPSAVGAGGAEPRRQPRHRRARAGARPGAADGTARVTYRGTQWTARLAAGRGACRRASTASPPSKATGWCSAPADVELNHSESAAMEIALILAVIAAIFIFRTFKIVPQQHAWVVERLGKYDRTLTPGLNFVVPFIERVAYKHSLKEVPLDVPSQVCITRDNTQLQVDGIIYFQVTDPMRASYGSSNYIVAITQLAQTLLRSVIGKMELDKTFEERDHINASVVSALDEAALNWGVKVLRYEIKDLTPPKEILHAMQAQITAEREKRALIAASEGRKQEQINIATGEREAFIARSEGEAPGRDQQGPGRGGGHHRGGRRHGRGHPQDRRGHPVARRRAGGAAQGGREGRRGLRPARAEEQHHDRARQHERGVGADRHGDGAAQGQGTRSALRLLR